MGDESVVITARCLCKKHEFKASVPPTRLPLKAVCCHCDSCRHATGALYFVDVEWPNRDEDLSGLSKYSFSKNTDIFFCGTCSSQMFCRGTEPGAAPGVTCGVLENLPNLVEYEKHIFVGDTIDGGASIWLLKNYRDRSAVRRWTARSDTSSQPSAEISDDWPEHSPAPAAENEASPEYTPLRCHCKGVDLVLRSAVDMKSTPASEVPFFVDPKTFKYLASIDVCNSCRLSFGVDLTNWTFANLDHICFPASEGKASAAIPTTVSALKEAVSAADKDPRLGTLTYYQSSPNVERYFCSRCAASVLYAVHDRPDLVDIGVGLLDHPSGARAEGLLSWDYGRATWIDDTTGGWREGLARGAVDESEEWRIRRGHPKCWRRVLREEAAARASA